ncbi:MAG: chromosomal replication initiator protein DnaA [Clostridiales bacterium]|nr:chromosomal replication initiator protein DnaA [Clostridiales bacterium]
MYNLVKSKWDEILKILKEEHDIMDVSFNTWIKPLEIYSVENNIITLLVPDENITTSYLHKKYYLPLKVVIQEVTCENLDLEFLHPSEIRQKSLKPSSLENSPDIKHIDDNTEKKLEAKLNPNYTFDNFVIGANNNFAQAYALAVAESPAEVYNPLFIYGGVGLGKTHLMHSIGNFILDRNPNAKVRCVTSEVFTNEVISAIRSESQSSIMEFRNKYRNLDVLLIDDIQFIIGKERSQEEFFHTFNTLKESNKQIVISSDKPPKSMTTLEGRFRSRFEMGLTVDISSPDYETRMAIIKKKAENEGYNIDDEIFEYIAENIKSNVRELEGALTKIVAFSRVSRMPIDLDIAKEVLKDIISPDNNKVITPELIIETVADHFGISVSDISSKKKSQDIVFPRQIAMFLCRQLTECSLQSVGHLLGKKDHTTVMHSINKVQNEIETNDSTRNTVEVIKKKINPN